MNPYRGMADETQNLARAMHETYHGKISGPILDRIDLWIEVPHVPYDTLQSLPGQSETAVARQAIVAARARQNDRLGHLGIGTNAAMSSRDIDATVTLSPAVATLLKTSAQKLNLSPRSYHRLIKVARTIADLDESSTLETNHVLEALQYRVPT